MTPEQKPDHRPSGRLQHGDHLQYLLTAYLFGDLSAAGKAEVEGHLKDCASCRQELAELRATLALTEEAILSEKKEYIFDDRRRARVLAGAKQARHGFLARMGLAAWPRFNPNWGRIAALILVLLTGGMLLVTQTLSCGGSLARAREQARRTASRKPTEALERDGDFSYGAAKGYDSEDTIVTSSLEKRKPEEYDERRPVDKFQNAAAAQEDLPPVEHPVVTHDEVEVSDHNETSDDMDRASAKGDSDKAISDIPLGGVGFISSIGMGGGRVNKKDGKSRPSPSRERVSELPIQAPKPGSVGMPKAPPPDVQLGLEKTERELKYKTESRLSEFGEDALKEPQSPPPTPAEKPVTPGPLSSKGSFSLEGEGDGDDEGRKGSSRRDRSASGKDAPPPPPPASPASKEMAKKSQSVEFAERPSPSTTDAPAKDAGQEGFIYSTGEAKPGANAQNGLLEQDYNGRRRLSQTASQTAETAVRGEKRREAQKTDTAGARVVEPPVPLHLDNVSQLAGEASRQDAGNLFGDVNTLVVREMGRKRSITVGGVLGEPDEKDSLNALVKAQKKSEVYDVSKENVQTRWGKQEQAPAIHGQQQGQQQQVLVQDGRQAEALNKMLKRNENEGWKADTNKGKEAIQQLHDNYVKDHRVFDSTEREPEKSEALLRAFNYYQAGNQRLDIDEFLRRPASIPAPFVTDEGLDEDEFIEKHGIRPFVDASRDHLSTFGLDVDTASYTRARALLQQGQLPPADAVRTEEFVNNFKQDYTVPPNETFGVFVDGMPAPFGGPNMDLVKIGIKSRDPRPDERKAAALTFVVDTSGSMARADSSGRERVELIRAALKALVEALQPEDSVCLVTFSDQARLALPRTQARFASRILDALDRLEPGGATNVEAGLEMGYRMADEAYSAEAINRVIFCSDGVANIGAEGPEQMLKLVKTFAGRGIDLNAIGFGMGKYNDRVLQELADRGNGQYHFVNTPEEAQKVFSEQLPPNLDTLARDAKAQVDFDPAVVKRYRLLGYEKRKIADADFRNDKIDAGEVTHSTLVTALYEIERQPGAHGSLGRIFLRWKDAALTHRPVVERNYALSEGLIASTREAAAPNLRFLACVAEFAELLRGSRWAQDGSYAAVFKELNKLPADFRVKPEWDEVRKLVWQAHVLSMREWLGALKGPGGRE